jgi:hypothetical protein
LRALLAERECLRAAGGKDFAAAYGVDPSTRNQKDRAGIRRSIMPEFPPEQDWKTLRTLHPVALDRFCQRVLEEIDAVAGATSRSSHERYLEIRDLVSRRGREMADAFDDMRRSRAVLRIARIRALGVLTAEEYSRFTDIIRDEVDRIAV